MNSTLYTAVLLLALLFSPIFYLQWRSKKDRNSQLKKLKSFCSDHQLKADLFDLISEKIIALDSAQRKLIFMNLLRNESQIIDLSTIRSCDLMINTVKNGTEVQTLFIGIKLSEKNTRNINLQFYNHEESLGQNGELPIAKKWTAIIKEKI